MKAIQLNITIRTYILVFFSLTFALTRGMVFASQQGPTAVSLGIENTIAHIVYTPAHASGFFTSGNILAVISGSQDISGTVPYLLTENGNYTFFYLRGTGPYDSGMNYGPSNLRNTLSISDTITRMDHQPPIFNIVFDQNGYAAIYFSDNTPGVIASLNGNNYLNGNPIILPGNYTFRVIDVAGNEVIFTFSIFQTPPTQGGGGGGIVHRDTCPYGDLSPSYYDSLCNELIATGHTSPGDNLPGLGFSQELTNAYMWAHAYGITTMPTIQTANMTGFVLRKHLAKMISLFALTFVGTHPDTNKKCIFSDMNKESIEMNFYATLSCQLGLMGLQEDGTTPNSVFEPNGLVNRAQFGTVLSRLLFGDTYNVQPGERTTLQTIKNNIHIFIVRIGSLFGKQADTLTHQLTRYSKHLQALKEHKIMNNIDTPMMLELRGYIMLMLMRADKQGIISLETNTQK